MGAWYSQAKNQEWALTRRISYFVCIMYIHMKCRIIKSGVVCVYTKMDTYSGHYATVIESCPILLSTTPVFLKHGHFFYFLDLNVTITIQYSPPVGVTLTPPNYRPATNVSLRCDAVGASGSVSYQWSSTCGSSCFVSGSSQTVSRDKLWSYDAGQHTCVVTDGVGSTGNATIQMNIIG